MQSGVRTVPEMEAAFARGAHAVLGWPIDDALSGTAARTGKPVAQPDQQVIVELIRRVDNEEPIDKLETTLRRDPSLAFKLLRYINSPAFGLRVEISSFRHAIMLLGYQRLKRWLALLLATASKDVNLRPVMFAAVRRGLLMEELVAGTGDEEMRSEMFICGVFSLLDRMFGSRSPSCSARCRCRSGSTRRWSTNAGPYQPYLAMVRAAEGESVFEFREAAEQLLMSVTEINRAQLRALQGAARAGIAAISRVVEVSSREPGASGDIASAAVRQVVEMFRASPFPTTLQDRGFRFVEVNAAFCAFTGLPREQILGRDFVDLLSKEDRQATLGTRRRFIAAGSPVEGAYVAEGRLIDAAGQRRWYRASRSVIADGRGEPLYLAVLQDTTSEHEARERADRSVHEIDDWFDLSPVGMVLFDDSGLLVRTNLAFDEMTGSVPVSLAEASPSVAALLAWGEGGALEALRPGSRPIESQGWVTQPGGRMRLLRAIVRCYRTAGGERRYMGVVEDRSIEEERDLAQIQIGAMMDTAGVGIATFQESSGWIGRRPGGGARRFGAAAQHQPRHRRARVARKSTSGCRRR